MKIALATVLLLFALCGCGASVQEHTLDYELPPALADCRIFRVSRNLNSLYIVRCPNSETSVSWMAGKTRAFSSLN